MKSIESITVGPSRAESKESAKVESIARVGQKLPWIDRLARLDRFRGLTLIWKKQVCAPTAFTLYNVTGIFRGRKIEKSVMYVYFVFSLLFLNEHFKKKFKEPRKSY